MTKASTLFAAALCLLYSCRHDPHVIIEAEATSWALNDSISVIWQLDSLEIDLDRDGQADVRIFETMSMGHFYQNDSCWIVALRPMEIAAHTRDFYRYPDTIFTPNDTCYIYQIGALDTNRQATDTLPYYHAQTFPDLVQPCTFQPFSTRIAVFQYAYSGVFCSGVMDNYTSSLGNFFPSPSGFLYFRLNGQRWALEMEKTMPYLIARRLHRLD